MSVDPWAPVVPALLRSPSWSFTRGPEVADLCALLSYEPMPEQELWLDATFAIDDRDGLPACSDLADIAGRQNLKTGEFVMTALGWLFITREESILWSAHEFGTSRDAFLLMRSLLESKPWANNLVRQYYASSNYMGIALMDGRALEFSARTTSQGRGKARPKAIWDEGLELRREHLGAQDAIKSTFPWAQTLIGSSGLKSYSEVAHKILDQARKGEQGERDFVREFADDLPGDCELGAECTHVVGSPACRLDDPERYKRANPALGRIRADGRGLTLAAIQRERRRQPDPLIFARERLSWHEALVVSGGEVFAEDVWAALADRRSRIVTDRRLALHVAPDRGWSSVVAGGRNAAGKIHVEVPSKAGATPDAPRTYARWSSTAAVVPWFRRYLRKRREEMTVLLIEAGSQAASLVPALTRLGDDPKLGDLEIVLVPATSMPPACGFVLDAVAGEQLAHVGDPELQASFLAVGKRMVGKRTFVWEPRGGGDISAANAATMLAWHLESGEDEEDARGLGIW